MADSNDASLTPEKRLLELIEGADAAPKEAEAGPIKQKSAWADLFSPAGIRELQARLAKDIPDWLNTHKEWFGIKSINRVLKIGVLILFIAFIVDVGLDVFYLKQDFASSIKVPDSKMFDLPETKEAEAESSAVESWDLTKLFMPYGKRLEEAERIQKEQSTKLVEMIKNLKLTGISYNPKDPSRVFCMIEDVEKAITTFLREGDPIGFLRVKKIEEDKVLLESGNETVELR